MASSKKTVKTGTVTDEQGRVRFHGAFTGGFSAGYYNTVGSVEGFKPTQFVSSRSNRATRNAQSINDFMDEGDGLLGGKLSAVEGIDSFTDSSKPSRPQQDGGQLGDVLSGVVIQQQNDTIGRRLLSTMGWRAGHGIGPRVRRKRINYFDRNISRTIDMEVHPGVDLSKLPTHAQGKAVTFAPDDETQKIAFPPTKNDLYGLGFDPRISGRLRDFNQEENDEEGDSYGLDQNNRYHMSSVLNNNRTGTSVSSSMQSGKREPPRYGQGQSIVPASKRLKFSSGFAYNDEEDDVYTSNSTLLQLTNNITTNTNTSSSTIGGKEGVVVPYGYDITEQETAEDSHKQQQFAQNSRNTLSNIHQNVDHWLQKNTTNDDLSETLQHSIRCPSDQRLPLPGFHVARIAQTVPPYYPPPEVPKDFTPFHHFQPQHSTSTEGLTLSKTIELSHKKHVSRRMAPVEAAKMRSATMAEESNLLPAPKESTDTATAGTSAETAKPNSIFDLMKPEARARLQSVIHSVNPKSKLHIADTASNKPPLPPPSPPPPPPPPPATHSAITTGIPSTTATTTTTVTAADAVPARPMLTSSHLLNSTFAGLSAAFKNRFAAATTTEGAGTKSSIVLEGIATAEEYNKQASAQQQSREKKEDSNAHPQMKSTLVNRSHVRTVTLWAPAPLLCKRMNVKLPDISKTSQELAVTTNPGGIIDPVSQLLGTNIIPPVTAFGKQGMGGKREEEVVVTEAEAARQDVYQAEEIHKPALAVFKSIFEDSDTSDSGSESEQEEEREKQVDEGVDKGKYIEPTMPVNIAVQNSNSSDRSLQSSQRRKSSDYFNPDKTHTSASVSATVDTYTVDIKAKGEVTEGKEEESGQVKWVPNKLRTVGRTCLTTKQQQSLKSRQSFATADGEQSEDGGIQLVRTARSVITSESGSGVGVSKSQLTADRMPMSMQEGEGSDEEVFVAVTRRPLVQSVAGIGAAAPSVRRGRQRVQNNTLRQRLLSQQSEEGNEEEQVGGAGDRNEQDISSQSAVVTSRKTGAQSTDGSISNDIRSYEQENTVLTPGMEVVTGAGMEYESQRGASRWENSSGSSGVKQSVPATDSAMYPPSYIPAPLPPPLPPLPTENVALPPPPPSSQQGAISTQPPLSIYRSAEVPTVPPQERPVALSSAISKLQSSLLDPSQHSHDRKAHKHSKDSSKKHKSHKSHKDSKHKHKKDKHKHKHHKHKRQNEESDSSNSSSESD